MTVPGTWRGVVKKFQRAPLEIQSYFYHLPSLAENYPWEICISYMFGLVELAQNNCLYCGMVKLHRVDGALSRKAIDSHPLYRDDFRSFYQAIFGKKPKAATIGKLEGAETIRDRIIHGKEVTGMDKRKAVVDIIDFAERFNNDVNEIAGFRPFSNLRGFKGRGKALDKATSRWVLKGIGFNNM